MRYKFCTIVLLVSFFSPSSYSSTNDDFNFDFYFEEENKKMSLLEFLEKQDFQKIIKYLCGYKIDYILNNSISVIKYINLRYPLLEKDSTDIANILIKKQNEETTDNFNAIGEMGYDPIELLFLNDQSEIAIKIISNIDKNFLKKEWLILKLIVEGRTDINTEELDKKFLLTLYKVANNSNNMEMVKKLHDISGAHEMQNRLKVGNPIIFSDEANYIYKPFWSFNIFQLQAYASEMIEEMKPLFISENEIKKSDEAFYIKNKEGQRKYVRKVPFGYVFPNIFLKHQLLELNDPHRAVPEIFIVRRDPKKTTANFIFKLPASSTGEQAGLFYIDGINDVGSNVLSVDSNDFVIYQEYVEGDGHPKDQEFASLGHADFNAVQIIKSGKKSYLVDTKRQKNFFDPMFFPTADKEFCDIFTDLPFCKKGYGNNFDKKHAQKIVMTSKSINFDLRKKFFSVTLELK